VHPSPEVAGYHHRVYAVNEALSAGILVISNRGEYRIKTARSRLSPVYCLERAHVIGPHDRIYPTSTATRTTVIQNAAEGWREVMGYPDAC